jgi:hypothetical protein
MVLNEQVVTSSSFDEEYSNESGLGRTGCIYSKSDVSIATMT